MLNNLKKELEQAFILYKSDLALTANRFIHAPDIAEELVQDVFLAILVHNAKILDLKAYLFRAVKNKARNAYKRASIESKYNERTRIEAIELDEFPAVIPTTTLSCLSKQQLRIFTLNREGLSYRKIAIAEKLSVKTVNTHMHRALTKLRRHNQKEML